MSTSSSPRIRRNAMFAGLAEASRAVFAAALVIGLTRILGPDDYGLYALALGIGSLVLLPSDFGLSGAVGRFVAERRGDAGAVARVTSDGLRLKLLLSGAVSMALAAAAPIIADAYGEPGLEVPLLATAVALFAQSLFTLLVSVFVALGRVSLQALLYGSESALETGLVLSAALAGGGAGGAAFGRAGGFVAGALIGLVLALRFLGRGILPRLRPAERGSRLIGYSAALFVVDSSWAVFASIDILLIGAYLESADVGLFQAPQRLMAFVLLAGAAVATAVAPRVARHAGEPQAVGALMVGMRALVVLGLFAAVTSAVWADPLVERLLGADYAGSAEVLRASAPWLLLALLGPLVTVSLNFLGQARRRIPLVLGALGVNAVLDVLLIPRIGIVAGAISTGIAFALYLGGHLRLLRQELDLDLRPLARTTGRAAVAAAGLAVVLLALGTSADLALWRLMIGGMLGAAVYGGLLVVLGEVRVADARRVLAAARATRGG